MRRLALAVVACALLVPAVATAHPLGNFTVNQYSRVDVSGSRAYVLYVLDLAEVPTFQARRDVRRLGEDAWSAREARRLLAGIELRVDGRPLPLRELSRTLSFPPGEAQLRTTRLEVVFGSASLPDDVLQLRYADGNFPARLGWREIVVQAGEGARLRGASVPAQSVSDELREYPRDLLSSPLDVSSATATVVPGSGPGVAPGARAEAGDAAQPAGGFAGLIDGERLTLGIVLVSLFAAMFWGAAHALSPGHGKTIVAAYLVGSHGTRRDAILLGLTVTVTHTIGVFALGLVTLSLSEFILPEDLYPWLSLASALLVVAVGVGVFRWRLRDYHEDHHHGRAHGHHDHHDHDHGHHHHHDHDHGHHHHHDHDHGAAGGRRGLLGVGVSAGLIPCPTALVVLLAAISLQRVGFGLVLIVAFSVGLAATMSGVGLLAISARQVFDRVDFEAGILRLLPAVSAVAVLGLGVVMTIRALPQVA